MSGQTSVDGGHDQETDIKGAERGAGRERGHRKGGIASEIGTDREMTEETGIASETVIMGAAEGSETEVEVRTSTGRQRVGLMHPRNMIVNFLILPCTDPRHHRDRERTRQRSRSRSPVRNGTSTATRARSPPKAPRTDHRPPSAPTATHGREPPRSPKVKDPAAEDAMQVDSKTNGHTGAEEDEDSEDALLRKMMGFSTFKSTQNKKIPGNNVSGVRKEKSTNYRQYMNRTGGFNRPLSPSRD